MMIYAKYFISGLMALAFAVLIVALPIRLLMSKSFLYIAYNLPWMPPDLYGFTSEQRIELAPDALTFLLEKHPSSWLAQKTIEMRSMQPQSCVVVENTQEELCYLYNEREVQHMLDVQHVIQGLFSLVLPAIIIIILGWLIAIWWRDPISITSLTLRYTILLMMALIMASIFSATIAWDSFFTAFHGLFFEGDSWLFYYWDTLIRLFPEPFWYTATILLCVLIALELGVLHIFTNYLDKLSNVEGIHS